MISFPVRTRFTALFLLLWMGFYTHGALSHLGHPHYIGGVPVAEQKGPVFQHEIQSFGIEKCPWGLTGTLYYTTVLEAIETALPVRNKIPLMVILPSPPLLRVDADPRAPPRCS